MNPSEQRPTPETDAATFEAVVGCYPDGSTATESVVDSNITRKLERERDEARQQLEAMREAVVQLRDSLEVGKDSVETWDWCNTTLAKLQPFLKP
jgi:hypothetical protein